jgi:hypothetical protein
MDYDYDYEDTGYDYEEREPHDLGVTEYDVPPAGESWTRRARQAAGRPVAMAKENSIAMGLVALAAGALIGMALPATRMEGRYVSEARTRLKDRAREWYRKTTRQS